MRGEEKIKDKWRILYNDFIYYFKNFALWFTNGSESSADQNCEMTKRQKSPQWDEESSKNTWGNPKRFYLGAKNKTKQNTINKHTKTNDIF